MLSHLEVDACLGMYGYGSDGELALEEVTGGIARAAERDGLLGAWGLTHGSSTNSPISWRL